MISAPLFFAHLTFQLGLAIPDIDIIEIEFER